MRITQKEWGGIILANHWGHTAAMVKHIWQFLTIPSLIAKVPIYIYKFCISIRITQIRFLVLWKF